MDKNAYYQFSSLSHVGLCNPTDCSTPGFPVHHQLLELVQIHVMAPNHLIYANLLVCLAFNVKMCSLNISHS